MVLSPIHFVPSIAAAILIVIITFTKQSGGHKILAYGIVFFGTLGFIGFILGDWTQLLGLSFHSVHAWIGLFSFLSSIAAFLFTGKSNRHHCTFGQTAGILAIISLGMGLMIISGLVPTYP